MAFPIQNVNRAHPDSSLSISYGLHFTYHSFYLSYGYYRVTTQSVSQQTYFHPGEQTRVKALVTVMSQRAVGHARNQSVLVACKLPSCTVTQTTPSPVRLIA